MRTSPTSRDCHIGGGVAKTQSAKLPGGSYFHMKKNLVAQGDSAKCV